MSAYEKESQAGLFDYDGATLAFQSSASFDSCPQLPFTAHLFPPALDNPSISDDESLPYMAGHEYAGSSFGFAPSPNLDDPCREAPEVMSFSPTSGPDGCKIAVYLQSAYDLFSPPSCTFAVTFGSARCECAMTPLGFHNSAFQYALLVDAPTFSMTGCSTFSVPLQMIVDGNDGLAPQVSHIGNFTYDQDRAVVGPSPPRKRRISSASEEASSTPGKQLRINDDVAIYASNDGLSPSPYSPYISTPGSTSTYSSVQYQPDLSSGLMPTQCDVQQQHQLRVKAPSPLSASWSPAVSAISASTHSPTLSATPISHGSGVPSPNKATANPPLIRTSTIQQSLAGSGPNSGQPFNPYAMYPSKAVLKLNGDLDAMTDGWSKDERECHRRLVQFTRRQNGNAIYADFKPVTPAERTPNSICISCIYWAGKDECFVTSVDTIYLLESLVGVRFTVEEKNRIRRNLEGFRPLTVSKTKSDSEDFFKVIMGFPNPKPRNIEKDVKAFPWKILAHALKKIIGKYSASYSSTAGALPTTLASNFISGGSPDSATESRAASPQSHSERFENSENFKFSCQSPAPSSMPITGSHVPRTAGLQVLVPNGTSPHAGQPTMYEQPGMHLAPTSRQGSYAYSWVHKNAVGVIPPHQPELLSATPHGLPSPIHPFCQTTTGA